MWRMYQILRYLRKYPNEDNRQIISRKIRDNGANEHDFILYLLLEKSYLEHWLSSLKKYWEISTKSYQTASLSSLNREHERKTAIKMAIKGCIEKGYIENNDGLLKITPRGWRFSGAWKVGFLNEYTKEVPTISAFVTALIGGSLFGIPLSKLMPKIIAWLGL